MPVLACSRGRGRIQNTNLTCSEAGSEAEPIGEDSTRFVEFGVSYGHLGVM